MHLLLSTAREARRLWRRPIVKHRVSRLQSNHDATAKSLAKVLDAVYKGNCTQEEMRWISTIEQRRESLLASTTEVALTDYGCGPANSKRTTEEMLKGKTVTGTIGSFCRASKDARWALLLFKLLREFAPSNCLELGTCVGISAAYQAAALELNQHGKLVTLEGGQALAAIAQQTLDEVGLPRCEIVVGRFQDTLDQVVQDASPIDYAFIDGHHDEHATLEYFAKIRPHLSEEAVLVFDDISWGAGMKRAWNAIQDDRNLKIVVDLTNMGVCIYTKSPSEKRIRYRVPL
ncbi:MAG: class I SAM-dependent methyltransferase [Planctomycetes bacterium]|nr:class I SAM-dependent methyltransferase [Planctomycetota bacterium]